VIISNIIHSFILISLGVHLVLSKLLFWLINQFVSCGKFKRKVNLSELMLEIRIKPCQTWFLTSMNCIIVQRNCLPVMHFLTAQPSDKRILLKFRKIQYFCRASCQDYQTASTTSCSIWWWIYTLTPNTENALLLHNQTVLTRPVKNWFGS
jgi:hypothetical protein